MLTKEIEQLVIVIENPNTNMIMKNPLKEKMKTEIEKVIYQEIQQLLGYIKKEDEKNKRLHFNIMRSYWS